MSTKTQVDPRLLVEQLNTLTAGSDEITNNYDSLTKVGGSAVPMVMAAMETDDPELVAKLVEAFVAIGRPAISELVSNLGSTNQFVQGGVISALSKIGQPAALPVLNAMKEGDPLTIGGGKMVIEALGAKAIEDVRLACEPTHASYSTHAVDLLIKIDPAAHQLLARQLEQGLDTSDQYIAGCSISAFQRIGNPAAPRLVELMEEQSPFMQQNAVNALVSIGEDASRHVVAALGSENQLVQQNGMAALRRIGKTAVPALYVEVNSQNATMRANVRTLLIELGSNPDKKSNWWNNRR